MIFFLIILNYTYMSSDPKKEVLCRDKNTSFLNLINIQTIIIFTYLINIRGLTGVPSLVIAK